MKRALCLVLALLFAVCFFPRIPSASAAGEFSFLDVTESDWFYEPVGYVYENGIMKGVSDDFFDPGGNTTRAMFVTILARIAGAEESLTGDFSDVDSVSGAWYAGYVGWAVERGIVEGYPDGQFRPDEPVTREQAAAIISRYIEYTGILPMLSYDPVSCFADGDEISSWAKKDVDEMRRLGIAVGGPDRSYSPLRAVTRAETATLMMRLHSMLDYLTLGEPESIDYTVEGGRFVLMNAWDLYYSGIALGTGYAGVSVAGDAGMPYVTEDPDDPQFTLGIRTDNADGIGFGRSKNANKLVGDNAYEIDSVIAQIDLEAYPFLRFGFAETDGSGTTFGVYSEGGTESLVPMDTSDEPALSHGDKTGRYGIVDVSGDGIYLRGSDRISLTLIGTDKLDLGYFAAFRTREEAEAFDPAEYAEALSARGKYETVEVNEATDGQLDAVIAEAEAKAEAIINSGASFTEADITGTCYYISSIHGDDSNDGLSRETPWRSFVNLYRVKAGGAVVLSNLKPGDGVFLECGSVFNVQAAGTYDYLDIMPGVTYTSYGEGEKPTITKTLDLGSPSGTWVATEWDNVWRLDMDTAFMPGNITFEKGDRELWGIFVFPENADDPFAGKTKTYGWVSNGEETFHSGGIRFASPGDLCHNLEYYGDYVNGGLWVYFDRGNPGEYFDRINISRNGQCVGNGDDYKNSTAMPSRFDNIAIKHTGGCGIGTGDVKNLYITNCVLEWIGGDFQGPEVRYGNAFQNWGNCDGIIIRNCYVKDVYDAGLSTQGGAGTMRNFYVDGCVLDRCDFPFEFFNHDDKSIQEVNELSNIILTNNYVLRTGVGFCDARADRRSAFLYSSYSDNGTVMDNFRYENNVNVITREYGLYSMHVALGQTTGTILSGNTYYVDPGDSFFLKTCFDFRRHTGSSKTLYPFTSRYLTYLSTVGVERGGTFYAITNPDRHEP